MKSPTFLARLRDPERAALPTGSSKASATKTTAAKSGAVKVDVPAIDRSRPVDSGGPTPHGH